MIKIEAITLEDAYTQAASTLECSVTELNIEVVQVPSKGFLGLFAKKAIIVAAKAVNETESKKEKTAKEEIKQTPKKEELKEEKVEPTVFKDTIMPQSFVSTQDEDDDYNDIDSEDYEDELLVQDEVAEESSDIDMQHIVDEVSVKINELFKSTCFNIDKIEVSAYDESTVLVEFKGEDAALLIGKEGYRYKALSYMIFNWINAKYQVQLRLEIAEFLKNQEESVSRYLESVRQNVERDGRTQTKILDGVLVQIALKELRTSYPDKYVAIRTTRDGLKYIIINDYHN